MGGVDGVAEGEGVHALGAVAEVERGAGGELVDGGVVLRRGEVPEGIVLELQARADFEGEIAPFVAPGEVGADTLRGGVRTVGPQQVAPIVAGGVEGVAQVVVAAAAEGIVDTHLEFALLAVGARVVDAEAAAAREVGTGGVLVVAQSRLGIIVLKGSPFAAEAEPVAVEVGRQLVSFVVEFVLVPHPAASAVAIAARVGVRGVTEVIGLAADVVGALGTTVAQTVAPTGIGVKPAREAVHGVELVAEIEVGIQIVGGTLARASALPLAGREAVAVEHGAAAVRGALPTVAAIVEIGADAELLVGVDV